MAPCWRSALTKDRRIKTFSTQAVASLQVAITVQSAPTAAARLQVVRRGAVIPAASLRLPFAYPTLLLTACFAGAWLVTTVAPATAGALIPSILAGARGRHVLRRQRRR